MSRNFQKYQGSLEHTISGRFVALKSFGKTGLNTRKQYLFFNGLLLKVVNIAVFVLKKTLQKYTLVFYKIIQNHTELDGFWCKVFRMECH